MAVQLGCQIKIANSFSPRGLAANECYFLIY